MAREDEQRESNPALEPPSQTELAVERTLLAYERTLMAWLRTSMAMIGFGFSLHQFFELMVTKEGLRPFSLFGPRSYGLGMMVMGIVMLLLASFQHVRTMRRLRARGVQTEFSLALAFALTSLLLGFVALAAAAYTVISAQVHAGAEP